MTFPLLFIMLSGHYSSTYQHVWSWLVLLGLVWPRLTLSDRTAAATFWLAIYGTFCNWAGTLLAAIWGTGRSTPLAAPGRSGTPLQEGVVDFLLISISIVMVAVCGLVLWGLRARR